MSTVATLPSVSSEGGLPRYLTETRKFPLLEASEEAVCAKRWRDHGDREAAYHHAFCISAPCRTGRDEHHDHTLERQSRMASLIIISRRATQSDKPYGTTETCRQS